MLEKVIVAQDEDQRVYSITVGNENKFFSRYINKEPNALRSYILGLLDRETYSTTSLSIKQIENYSPDNDTRMLCMGDPIDEKEFQDLIQYLEESLNEED